MNLYLVFYIAIGLIIFLILARFIAGSLGTSLFNPSCNFNCICEEKKGENANNCPDCQYEFFDNVCEGDEVEYVFKNKCPGTFCWEKCNELCEKIRERASSGEDVSNLISQFCFYHCDRGIVCEYLSCSGETCVNETVRCNGNS